MAHKMMTLTDLGAQVYRNRMLTAGDPVTLSGRDARLFAKHGWAEEPKAKKAEKIIPTVEEVLSAEVVKDEPKPAPKPRKTRKRKAKK